MKIAVDAMGGDHAPAEIVAGALSAAPHVNGEIILVGQVDAIQKHVTGPLPPNVHLHPASEVIEMDDKPTEALRKKKDSSILVCCNLVKEGQADVFVSAGNTGACTAASLLTWRQTPGVHRPAIASLFPTKGEPFLLLDAGASPDVDPEHMLEFALMGRAYAQKVMGRPNPKVKLLNIGEEPGKGNAFAKKAFEILAEHPWFDGNTEGKDMFRHPTDVVICDAFVGNIVLKTAEGIAEFIMGEIRAATPRGLGRLFFLPVRKKLKPLKKKVDYAEYGGSPLLGLNGLTIICHGRSNAKAMHNAILQAARAAENDLVQTIRSSFESADSDPS